MQVGPNIRDVRKSIRYTIKQLAEKVGVSYLTIQRIETGKISPSVALLSEIAHQLKYPIEKFLKQKESLIRIKANEQPIINSGNLKLRLLLPKGVIDGKISVSLGEAKKGEFIKHRNEGFELIYLIKGRCVFNYGKKVQEINGGDMVYFNGRTMHSVIALEVSEFFSVYFHDKE